MSDPCRDWIISEITESPIIENRYTFLDVLINYDRGFIRGVWNDETQEWEVQITDMGECELASLRKPLFVD